ncbi:acyl-CoA dehydrogenase family protein [Aeromicrobium ginsengisoli]|uniref:Acyl-CoA dehydrogenase n=1 Tax=Aeromicrobium ginsengisoli TaxID=363867 RepID=A0A5M4F956_9ACTN|nr:acyl-CoA dehydrogenase family protein [Aeromicrobium ginsengisoli]KAA1394292.1 acyl-CoA dehydrogenase [Aeromicrobium ginsengisoli]
MNTELTEEALEIGRVVHAALTKAGGVDIARAVEGGTAGPDATDILARIGVWELRPRESVDDAEAAAAVCRAAGRVALPVPVAERLSSAPESGYDALAVVGAVPRVNLAAASSDLRWAVIDGAGVRSPVTSIGPMLNTQLGGLVSPVEIGAGEDDLAALPLALTLPCWTLLGMMDSAMAMTRQHLLDRKQFGQPLASFQALQFRLADTATALLGFDELAKYTLWSVVTGQPGALVDAIACRLAAIETAEILFRTGHQMHGAMGFCDEVDLSWLSRHSQPARRLPWGKSQTQARLLDAMTELPFDGLYGQGLVGIVPTATG